MAKVFSIKLRELIVVSVLLVLIVFVLRVVIASQHHGSGGVTAVWKGRDIYVAITGANTEREPLGMPHVWPSDPGFSSKTTQRRSSNPSTGDKLDIADQDFTNSTEYFMWLYDHEHIGTEEHSPYVAGFDYGKLAGTGVKSYSGKGLLKAKNNIWTIAKNLADEVEDIVPVLITRNLDASFLYSQIEGEPTSEIIPLGETWDTPFSNKGAVIIRKGGGMFKVRQKYATPLVIYNRQSFNANVKAGYPLKYLTPAKEVLPLGKSN